MLHILPNKIKLLLVTLAASMALMLSVAVPATAAVTAPVATASPTATAATPNTLLSEISYEGSGNFLATCGSTSGYVWFRANPGGCYTIEWTWNQVSSGNWHIHPSFNSGSCITVSPNTGDLYIATCGSSTYQVWKHYRDGSSNVYSIYNVHQGWNVTDPGSPGTNHIAIGGGPGPFGYNGQSIEQVS